MMVTAVIVLPEYFNPDSTGHRVLIAEKAFFDTANDLTKLFGGATVLRYRDVDAVGYWHHKGVVERDALRVIDCDIDDTDVCRGKLLQYVDEVVLERFQQTAIYVKFVPCQAHLLTRRDIE